MSSNPAFDFILSTYNKLQQLDKATVVDLITHAPQYYSAWWTSLLKEAPEHLVIETGLIAFIVWLMFIRKTVDPAKSSKNASLSKKEEEWLIETWQPEPLVSIGTSEKDKLFAESMMVIDSVDGNYLTIRGVPNPVLNVASYDFLGMSVEPNIKAKAVQALDYYGCGSCGPRGFYGTIDQHLMFEDVIAKFMGTEEAISYSDSASTVSSAIPAFAKKGDLLIVDEAVSEPVLTGLNLSRSTVQFFRHNDMDHLRTILDSIAKDDKRLRRDATQQRRFIVVEGLYRNTGDLCPLKDILKLKDKYCYRVIMDETLSFGTVGRTGRGVTEHFGVKISDVEIITLAMDTCLASVGGVCIGSREIVDHQRLSGAGYCFSASAPPFLSAVAIEALKTMEEEPERLVKLGEISKLLRDALDKVEGVTLRSREVTPVIHLELTTPLESAEAEAIALTHVAAACVTHGVAISANKFALQNPSKMRPSLMLNASTKLSKGEVAKIAAVLDAALRACEL